MIINNFLLHHWMSFIRNGKWRRNIASKILYTFLALYISLMSFMFAKYIDKILTGNGQNPIDLFNSILVWYIAIDLLLRCFLQSLPVIHTLPYLQFKIRKTRIVNYLIAASFWNFFNIIPWLFILPFAIKILIPAYGLLPSLAYLFGFLLIVLNNNILSVFLGFLIKRNIFYYFIPIGFVVLISSLGKTGFSLGKVSISLGYHLIHANFLVLVSFITSIVGLILLTKNLLMKNFYIDLNDTKSNIWKKFNVVNMEIFNSMTEIGHLMALEINLLMRNKRSRQMLVMIPLLVAYFLFLVINVSQDKSQLMRMFFIAFLSGVGSVYGQFLFSWESSFFDGIMTRKMDIFKYIKAKYYFISILSILGFIPMSITFAIQEKANILIMLSFLIFSLGVNNFIIIFLGTYNDGRIDLSRSQYFNYQGVGGAQLILTLIIMALPLGVYTLMNYFINSFAGSFTISALGLTFIIFHNWWLKRIIVPQFNRRKYRNLEGFRKLTS